MAFLDTALALVSGIEMSLTMPQPFVVEAWPTVAP
jgi:hypothetical protein